MTMYAIGVLYGSAGLLASFLSGRGAVIVAAICLASLILAISILERAPYERQQQKPDTAMRNAA